MFQFNTLMPFTMLRILTIALVLLPLLVSSQTFINPSLEDWGDSAVCEINVPPDNWFNYSNSGIGPDEANYPLCSSSIPGRASQGRIYARFMAGNPVSGEGMHQVVLGFAVGRTYRVSFDYAGSNRWGGSDSCHFRIFLNGTPMDSTPVFSSRDTTWRRHVYAFTAPTTAIDFGFRALVPHYQSAGGSAAIDNFSFQESVISGLELEDSPVVDVSVGPNPFVDRFWLELSALITADLTIMDLSGRIVYQFPNISSGWIDGSSFASGSYLLILSKEGRILSQKRLQKWVE